MTNEELEELVKKISIEYFGRDFKHQAIFNSRLRTTGGRYHLASHNLDFNPKIIEYFSSEVLEGIIKHELCHYHLHIEKKGYRHGDADFKEMLEEVGGLRYTPSFEAQEGKIKRWVYRCKECDLEYYRKRRFNTAAYRCGQCGGHLILKGQEKIKTSWK